MFKCTITVSLYVLYTYTASVCANTYTRTVGTKYCKLHTDTVGKSMGTQENGKYKYNNTRIVLELMHTTIECGLIGNANMLISIPMHCTLQWAISPKQYFT